MSGGWKIEKDLCRCCHAEGSFHHLTQPFFNLGQPEVYADMLHQTLNIDITQVTGVLCEMTYTICENCVLRLRDATNFKRQVLLCEDRFKDMYRDVMKALSPTFEVKQEISITLENVKEEVAQNEDDDTEESIHLRFDDDDDEDDVEMEVKLDELKKDKDRNKPTKAKPKPKPKPRAVKKPVKAMTSKEGTSEAGKKTEMKPQKGVKLRRADYYIIQEGKYKCKLCENTYITKGGFSIHFRSVHTEEVVGIQIPSCGVCQKKFVKPSALAKHQKSVHLKEKTVACDVCGMQFFEKWTLIRHRKNHDAVKQRFRLADYYTIEDDRYKCKLCDNTNPSKGSYSLHFRTAHAEEILGIQIPTCGICQKKFATPRFLLQHQKSVHMKEKTVACNTCGKSFYDKSHLSKHMKSHDGRTLHCEYCSKKFRWSHNLKDHLRMHTGEKPYVCALCNKTFVQKASLNYHAAKDHPGTSLEYFHNKIKKCG